MRTLTIIRHAKAGWEDSVTRDFDRPLNHRGSKEVARIADMLEAENFRPDLCLASPAVRAWSTASAITDKLGLPRTAVIAKTALYNAMADELLGVIRTIDDRHSHVLVCGHNPGLHDLINQLTGELMDMLPTCAVVTILLDVKSWHEVEAGKGSVGRFRAPDLESLDGQTGRK